MRLHAVWARSSSLPRSKSKATRPRVSTCGPCSQSHPDPNPSLWRNFDFEYCHQGPFDTAAALLEAFSDGSITVSCHCSCKNLYVHSTSVFVCCGSEGQCSQCPVTARIQSPSKPLPGRGALRRPLGRPGTTTPGPPQIPADSGPEMSSPGPASTRHAACALPSAPRGVRGRV